MMMMNENSDIGYVKRALVPPCSLSPLPESKLVEVCLGEDEIVGDVRKGKMNLNMYVLPGNRKFSIALEMSILEKLPGTDKLIYLILTEENSQTRPRSRLSTQVTGCCININWAVSRLTI